MALAGDVPEPEIEPTVWSVSGTTAKLQASKTAGYTLDDDDTRVKHADEETTVNATAIKGLAKGLIVKPDGTIDGIQLSGKTISLANKVLGDNVQIGKNYEFNFTTDCRGASITGTAGADTVNVEGTNMTISGGRGNDTVTLGGARNTFVYKNGDGDDVIADFTADDKIKIASGTPTVETSAGDVIIHVGKGSIKLTDAAGQDITLLDADDYRITYNDTASYLLADADYSEAAQLDTLLDNAVTDYSLGKLDTTNPASLATDDVIVSYGSDK